MKNKKASKQSGSDKKAVYEPPKATREGNIRFMVSSAT